MLRVVSVLVFVTLALRWIKLMNLASFQSYFPSFCVDFMYIRLSCGVR